MKLLLLEDEPLSAERLTSLLRRYDPAIEVLAVLDSVHKAAAWLGQHPRPQLLLVDLHLADGLSLDLFEQVRLTTPVIFTTAHPDYSLRAFRTNAVDYLLKPVDFRDLSRALDKYQALHQPKEVPFVPVPGGGQRAYKQRFLVKVGQQLRYVEMGEVAYFHFREELVYLVTSSGNRLPLDYSMDQLQELLDPREFFRINRQCILRPGSVRKIHLYFNSRLKLDLFPPAEGEMIVARDRVAPFKAWLDA